MFIAAVVIVAFTLFCATTVLWRWRQLVAAREAQLLEWKHARMRAQMVVACGA